MSHMKLKSSITIKMEKTLKRLIGKEIANSENIEQWVPED